MKKSTRESRKDANAEVKFFPPLVGIGMVLVGLFLESNSSKEIFSNQQISMIIGVPIFVIGIGLQAAIIKALKKANTTPLYKKPTTLVLQNSFYSRSRNPMFLSIFAWNLGLAFVFNTYWLILTLLLLYVYVRYYVVRREEMYLEQKFGDDYQEYKSKVPRWL